MSDDEADEEAALANDRVKMVSILTVVGRQRAKVSKVAAGEFVAVWQESGFGVDDLTELLQEDVTEEAKQAFATVVMTGMVKEGKPASRIWAVQLLSWLEPGSNNLLKEAQALTSRPGVKTVPGSGAAYRAFSPVLSDEGGETEDYPSDDGEERRTRVRHMRDMGGARRTRPASPVSAPSEASTPIAHKITDLAGELNNATQRGLAIGLEIGQWPAEAEIEELKLGSNVTILPMMKLFKGQKEELLSTKVRKIIMGNLTDAQKEDVYQNIKAHLYRLAKDVAMQPHPYSKASSVVYEWWEKAAEATNNSPKFHMIYINRYVFMTHRGRGLPKVVDFEMLVPLLGSMIGAAPSMAQGKMVERENDKKDMTSLKGKVSQLENELKALREKVAAIKTEATGGRPGKGGGRAPQPYGKITDESGELVKCYKCGGKGHMSNHCREVGEDE